MNYFNQAGIILGPSILGRLPNVQSALFPQEGDVFLDLLSKIGYIFFIFLSGVKMDPETVLRTGIKAWTIGLVAATFPVIGSLVASAVRLPTLHRYRWPAVKNIATIQTIFPFPVIASMLVDLKIMNSELGRLALASALISDLVSNLTSNIITYGRVGLMGYANVIMLHSTVLTMSLILFIFLVGRPICLWIIHNTPEGKPVSKFHVTIMALLVLVVVLLTDNVGLNYQYGPFLLGLVVPDGPPLGATLAERLETLVSGLLAPLLVTYCGMNMNLFELFDLSFVSVVWILFFSIYAMKLVGVFIPAVICRVPIRDAVALAFIMSVQGVVQLSFYYYNSLNQVSL